MSRRNIAVFVPVYNEAKTIGSVLDRVRKIAGDRIGMLVVADDGSTDGSDRIAAEYAHHVVRLSRNTGNGAATQAALRYLAEAVPGCDAVIRIDGDGQHDPALLPRVINLLDAGTDVVVCSRFHAESDTSHAPPNRLHLNVLAAGWVRRATSWPVTDARSGFLGFRWPCLAPVINDLRTEGYGIPMELLLRIWHRRPRARYAEIPHPAMYQKGISERLDKKYATETDADRHERLRHAQNVFRMISEDLKLKASA